MLGARLRTRRKELRLTQAALAEIADLDQSTISLIEKGLRPNPGADVLQRLADALECSVDQLLGRADQPPPDELAALLSDLERLGAAPLTVAAYRQMGDKLTEPEDHKAVLVVVRSLRDTLRQQQARIKARRRQQPIAGDPAVEAEDQPSQNGRISARLRRA